jgi:hypothetical protein
MYRGATVTFGLICMVAVACVGAGDAGKREVVGQTASSLCNGADSLIFSNVEVSAEDEDLSGHEIVLRRRGGAWSGSSREAAGEFGAFESMESIKADSVPGSIAFSFPGERDTAVFGGRIFCDSLVGEMRLNRTMQIDRVAYRRILESGKPIPARLEVDAVDGTQGGVSAPVAEYRDSAGLFDPDGYYTMEDDLTIHGRRISWLEISTLEFYYGGELHYERPKLVQPPMVGISLSDLGDPNHHSRHVCRAPLITADSLWVRCADTPVGEVTLRGHFLDKAGWYWNKLAYENQPTVLLIARVLITSSGRIVHDGIHRFRYSAGD